MKMEIKYSFICKLDLELCKITENIVNVNVIINVRHPPLFGMDKKYDNFMRYVRINPIEDGSKRGYWKTFIDSTAFRFSFNLEISEMYSFVNQLYENVPCGVSFNSFEVAAIDPISLKYLDGVIREWDWNIRYDIDCIKQCGTKGSYFLKYVLFEKNKITTLSERNARDLFSAMYDHLQADPALTSLEFKERENSPNTILDEKYVLVKTVYVTPTRTVSTKEDLTMDSRGLRYIGVDNLILIKFRDENLCFFPRDLACEIVTPKCRDGIVVADRLFFEFGGSNSLFRECGTYFCAAKNKQEILSMYKKLGEFEPATAAKMSARMGQYFTSALKTGMQLRQSNVCLIDDIESKSMNSVGKPYCFTDGNGIMSHLFAQQISDKLELSYVPSAFQIRYAGYKGMLTVVPMNSKNIGGQYYPLLIDNNGPYFVLFRKSQKKFHVVGDELLDFDIVQWSAPAPFNLYRTFISVLDYCAYKDGKQQIVRERLRELNNAACYNIIKPLIDHQAFLDKLEGLPTYCPISKMETKNLMNEPFWRSMVEASVVEDASKFN
uniref:RNA-dependent RNA polymerase n=1 Tax=Panagrolaimus superbus TaxID=310955 RepID=A0A914XT18_9BILA